MTKRIRSMLTKIDAQLSDYDERVGSSLQMISCDPQGRISVADLDKALAVIKHKPDEEVGHKVIEKLDVDKDGFVELEHVLGLVKEEGLGALLLAIVCLRCRSNILLSGTLIDDEAQSLIGQGIELKKNKPRKEDIVQE